MHVIKMAMSLQELTVLELKDILRGKNLSSSGNKLDLMTRIQEHDQQETWKSYIQEKNRLEENDLLAENLRISNQEKEALAMELQTLRNELEEIKAATASRNWEKDFAEQLRVVRSERAEMSRQLELARQELEKVRENGESPGSSTRTNGSAILEEERRALEVERRRVTEIRQEVGNHRNDSLSRSPLSWNSKNCVSQRLESCLAHSTALVEYLTVGSVR